MLICSVHDSCLTCQATPLPVFEQENIDEAALQNLVAMAHAKFARRSGMYDLPSHQNAHISGDRQVLDHSLEEVASHLAMGQHVG